MYHHQVLFPNDGTKIRQNCAVNLHKKELYFLQPKFSKIAV